MRFWALIGLAVLALGLTGCHSTATQKTEALSAPAVKAGAFIYVPGMSAGAGDIRAQTRSTLDAVALKLKQAGSGLENACLVNVYLRNAADFAGMGEVYSSYFPKDPPARVTVMVNGLPDAGALVEISAIAVPDGAERRIVKPQGWSKSPLPYSYGVQSGNTVFLAGLISRNGVDNTNVKGDITAQTDYIMGNARAILKEANMALDDVAQSRVYITDLANFQAMNAAYRSAFTAAPPARATVRAGLTNSDYLVEIAMIAVKDPSRTAINAPGPDGKPGLVNPNFSQAIRVGDRLFVAGLSGEDEATKGDARAQTAQAVDKLSRTLNAAGFDLTNAVEGVAYVADPNKFMDVNAAYRAVFSKDLPALTAVSADLVAADAEGEFSLIAQK